MSKIDEPVPDSSPSIKLNWSSTIQLYVVLPGTTSPSTPSIGDISNELPLQSVRSLLLILGWGLTVIVNDIVSPKHVTTSPFSVGYV